MICSFIDLNSASHVVNDEFENKIQVCLVSLSHEPKSISRNSILFKYGTLEVDKHDNLIFRFVGTDSLMGTCFAIPDVEVFPIEEVGFVRDWIFVENRYSWNNLLI